MQTTTGVGLGKNSKAKYTLIEFDSIIEFANYAASNPDPKKSDRFHEDYNVCKSLADARDLAVDGWHAVREQVNGTLEPLREKLGDVISQTSVRVHDLVGYEPDIDRYLAGEMECMVDDWMTEAPKQGKVFTMMIDMSMSWSNSPDQILRRGATLIALVEAFIMCGYELELWAESTKFGDYGQNRFASVLVRLNRAGEPLDIDTMMFALGHPDFERRFTWSVGEMTPIMREKMGFNEYGYYGYNGNGSHFADRVGASAIIKMDGNLEMENSPDTWVLDQLEAQGVWDGDQ